MSPRLKTGIAFLMGAALAGTGSYLAHARDNERLPEIVRGVIRRTFPGMSIDDVDRERDRRGTYYKVQVERGDQEIDLEVTPEGWIRKIRVEIDDDELPERARQSLRRTFPRSRIREVEQISETSVTYRIIIREDNRNREVLVNLQGKILEIKNRR